MKKTILIIDDDELLSNLISMVLTAKGFNCVQANSGLKGFEVLENLEPDLILLDLRMPIMDGLSFLEQFRHHPQSSVPVLVVSGTDLEDTRDFVRLAGAAGQLVKPVAVPTLIMKVNELLAMQR